MGKERRLKPGKPGETGENRGPGAGVPTRTPNVLCRRAICLDCGYFIAEIEALEFFLDALSVLGFEDCLIPVEGGLKALLKTHNGFIAKQFFGQVQICQ